MPLASILASILASYSEEREFIIILYIAQSSPFPLDRSRGVAWTGQDVSNEGVWPGPVKVFWLERAGPQLRVKFEAVPQCGVEGKEKAFKQAALNLDIVLLLVV